MGLATEPNGLIPGLNSSRGDFRLEVDAGPVVQPAPDALNSGLGSSRGCLNAEQDSDPSAAAVGAQVQAISYNEFLPLEETPSGLIPGLGSSRGDLTAEDSLEVRPTCLPSASTSGDVTPEDSLIFLPDGDRWVGAMEADDDWLNPAAMSTEETPFTPLDEEGAVIVMEIDPGLCSTEEGESCGI